MATKAKTTRKPVAKASALRVASKEKKPNSSSELEKLIAHCPLGLHKG